MASFERAQSTRRDRDATATKFGGNELELAGSRLGKSYLSLSSFPGCLPVLGTILGDCLFVSLACRIPNDMNTKSTMTARNITFMVNTSQRQTFLSVRAALALDPQMEMNQQTCIQILIHSKKCSNCHLTPNGRDINIVGLDFLTDNQLCVYNLDYVKSKFLLDKCL